jgi:hypothetical protein
MLATKFLGGVLAKARTKIGRPNQIREEDDRRRPPHSNSAA